MISVGFGWFFGCLFSSFYGGACWSFAVSDNVGGGFFCFFCGL